MIDRMCVCFFIVRKGEDTLENNLKGVNNVSCIFKCFLFFVVFLIIELLHKLLMHSSVVSKIKYYSK